MGVKANLSPDIAPAMWFIHLLGRMSFIELTRFAIHSRDNDLIKKRGVFGI
jgi:hypothetical protein